MKADAKAARKKIVKKRTIVVESSLSFNNEVLVPPLEEELYTMLEAAPKNGQWFVHFVKAKWQVPISTMSFSIF
jgi:hypothetical protein